MDSGRLQHSLHELASTHCAAFLADTPHQVMDTPKSQDARLEKKKNLRVVSYNAFSMSAKNLYALISNGTEICYFMIEFDSEIEPSRENKYPGMTFSNI